MLYPDWTTFLQMGLFLLVYLVLGKLLFVPFLRLQDLREEATSASDDSVEGSVADQVAQLEEAQRQLGLEIASLRDQALAEAGKRASEMLGKAHETAAGHLAKANASLEQTYLAVAKQLQGSQDEMVKAIVGQLAGSKT